MVYAANDYYVNTPMFFSYLFFGGFNDHIFHHLFPTVDKVHFLKCRDILEGTMKEFNLDYKKIELITGNLSVIEGLVRKRPDKTIKIDYI